MAMAPKRSLAAADAVSNKPSDLTPELAVGEALQRVLAGAVRHLRLTAARGDPAQPETIHRFRVALRRLRALLSAFGAALPTEERRALGRSLAGFSRRYGGVRDWDVLLAGTIAPLAAALPEDGAAAEIAACAAEARRRALPEATLEEDSAAIAAALDSALFLRRPSADREAIWALPINEFAAGLLKKRHRRLRRLLKHLETDDQAVLHKVRLKAKKLRYPAEIFGVLFDERAAAAYFRRLIQVQSSLGHLNDIETARHLLASLPLSGRAQALAAGWLARDAAAARAAFPKTARDGRRSTSFWEG